MITILPVDQIHVIRCDRLHQVLRLLRINLTVHETMDDPHWTLYHQILVQSQLILATVLSKIFLEQCITKLMRVNMNISRLQPVNQSEVRILK